MKIYTKTGDDGETGLFGGPRVRKDSLRIEAFGAVDELNAWLGLARAAGLPTESEPVVEQIQHDLFALGAELATPNPARHSMTLIGAREIAQLESWIDRFETELAPLRQFILPGGSVAAAQLHVARTVCRRAERRLASLIAAADEPVSPDTLVYLNRLSDLLFVLARTANRVAGSPDVPWRKPERPAAPLANDRPG